jgi:hypothetical protein
VVRETDAKQVLPFTLVPSHLPPFSYFPHLTFAF